MNIVTLIQARRGSTRLPDKVLKEILGKPVLWRQIERMQGSRLKGELVVITTAESQDDAIEEFCKVADIHCYRGHSTDLLDRHYQAARQFGADAVVKIPSDCPLIDPEIIDHALQYYISHSDKYDYVSNLHPA